MVKIFNAYFNFGGSYNLENFEKEVTDAYYSHERIGMIIDLENRSIGMSNLSDFKKLKKLFEEDNLGVEKLEETIVLCKDGFKKTIIKKFIKMIPTKRPVIFY